MDSPHGAAVVAENFGLKGPRGWAFRAVAVRAEPGSLIAVEGPSGSGRTCLLLALSGRMKPSEGHAEVGGMRLPGKMAAVRRISALGPVPGVSDLDPALTVAEHLRERALLQRRFDGSLRALLRPGSEQSKAARNRIGEALTAAGLDLDTLPKGERTAVRDLDRLEALRLSVALALIGRPRLLAVDDTDLKLSEAERSEVWEMLRGVVAEGTTVLAVCSEAPQDAVVVRTGPAATATTSPTTKNAADRPAGAGGAAKSAAKGRGRAAEAPADSPAKTATETAETTAKAPQTSADAPVKSGKSATAVEQTAETGETGETATRREGRESAAEHHKDDNEEGAADALAETGRA
ncbi:ATP-binding cassette domain-containing protein [Streptomyces sp. NPDC059169]|uniref:ATP-binding cassette domain-containing protein n=1 Tax=unclassified Streptomyces TaxID=2593676 RepID=UPI0036B7B0C5